MPGFDGRGPGVGRGLGRCFNRGIRKGRNQRFDVLNNEIKSLKTELEELENRKLIIEEQLKKLGKEDASS